LSTTGPIPAPHRGIRPLKRLRRSARRWSRQLGISLGLLPPLANRGYMICATARSGSNFLSQLLASTGQLGRPLEYFNTPARRIYTDPEYPKNRAAQIEIVRSIGATPNGIYAVKVLPNHYLRARKKIDLLNALPNLQFVRLRRHDLLGQALSMSRAGQTGQIMASKQAKAEAVYDAQDIRRCIRDVQVMESVWDQVLLEHGVQPLTFTYEDVVRNPQGAIDQVAALLGLAASPPINPELVRVTVQRDKVTDDWRQRFLADTGAEFRHLAQIV
jgi:LPS sulfotransferase NodH